MQKAISFLFLFLLAPLLAVAQILPQEGRALNYRIVGFTFPEVPKMVKCKVQIAPGTYKDDRSFQKNVAITVSGEKNKIVAEVPSFGQQYTWRSVYFDERSKTTKSELHHFSTMMCADVDTGKVRLKIVDSAVKYKDDYVFVDGNRVLYDMHGRPVWFFPKIEGMNRDSMHLRDLKISMFGTLTVIIGEAIYEINYNGDILWRGPGNGKLPADSTSVEIYHHEFTRLSNGHYMTMAFEQVLWRLPSQVDAGTYSLFHGKIKRENNVDSQKMFFGTIIEYDQQGNIVWRWRGSDYFKLSDLMGRMTESKLFNLNDTHANSFYFDEENQTLLISFRDINRIIKVQYPSGKVLETYGKLYAPGVNEKDWHMTNGVFCGQHSCRLSGDGNVYMFNNNVCHRRSLPTILVLKKHNSDRDTSLEKIWEFECPLDVPGETASASVLFSFGGNVSELPDRSFFVCMGGLYGKSLIVDRDKNILWCGQPEKWDTLTKRWSRRGVIMDNRMNEGVYRSSIISRSELERLIWDERLAGSKP